MIRKTFDVDGCECYVEVRNPQPDSPFNDEWFLRRCKSLCRAAEQLAGHPRRDPVLKSLLGIYMLGKWVEYVLKRMGRWAVSWGRCGYARR